MALMGALSFVLNMLDRELVLLAWIDTWGPTVGNVLRGALVVVGGALWFLGGRAESASSEDQS